MAKVKSSILKKRSPQIYHSKRLRNYGHDIGSVLDYIKRNKDEKGMDFAIGDYSGWLYSMDITSEKKEYFEFVASVVLMGIPEKLFSKNKSEN